MSGIIGKNSDRSSGVIGTATVAGIPSGSVIDYGGASEPSGWVFCDGSAFNGTSDTSFADLFSAIGNTFGGSDITDFQVPDFRGRVTIGKDNLGGSSADRITASAADTLGGSGGVYTHALSSGELASHTHTGPSHTHAGPSHTHAGPSHTHTGASHTHTLAVYNNGGGNTNKAQVCNTSVFGTVTTNAGGTGATGSGGTGNTGSASGTTGSGGTGTSGSTGSGTAHANDQPWMAITKIIKK